MNWDVFQSHLVLYEIEDAANVDLIAMKIEDMVKQAMGTAGPPQGKAKTNTTAPFWCAELERQRRIVRAKRKSYQQTLDLKLRNRKLEQYRIAKQEYKEKLNIRKKESWDKFVDTNLTLNPWGSPYKIFMKKTSPTTLATFKKSDGTYTTTWMESADLLINELIPKDSKRTKQKSNIEPEWKWRIY